MCTGMNADACTCAHRAAADEARRQETDAAARVEHCSAELRDTQGQLAQRKQVCSLGTAANEQPQPCHSVYIAPVKCL